MPSDSWIDAREREERHAQMRNDEWWANLTKEQRAEIEANRAELKAKETAERDRQRVRARTIQLANLWERMRHHTLSNARRTHFLSRQEAQQLVTGFGWATLERAAVSVLAEHDGELLLKDWLEAAPSAWEAIKAEADARPKLRPEPNSWTIRPISKQY